MEFEKDLPITKSLSKLINEIIVSNSLSSVIDPSDFKEILSLKNELVRKFYLTLLYSLKGQIN